jgi:pimeloyl-ACP methyl ester carboxylesterase
MSHYLEFGDASGFPVVYCHGTPGSALEAALVDAPARQYRLRLIAPDRPGYGWAPAAFGMGYAAWGRATARFLAELGIDRYGLLAVSGGVPNALALASADGHRVVAISLASALGPLAEPELARSASGYVRWMVQQAARDLGTLDRLALGPIAALGRALPLAVIAFIRLHNSPPDRRILGRPDIKRLFARNIQRACRQGGAGAKRDLALMAREWDFALADIANGVKLWHGLEDSLLFPDHGRWLAHHLSHADLTLVEGEGHFSLPIVHAATILRDMAERCRGTAPGCEKS